MRETVGALLTLLACAAVPFPSHGQVAVPVAAPGAVVLDGVMDDSEWRTALALGDEDITLLVQQTEDHLLLGLRTSESFVVSVCLTRGRDVWVLHASAAVGRARYVARGDVWDLEETFSWRLRDTAEGPATRAQLEEHMAEFGWATTTVTTGAPGEMEFSVSRALLDRDSSRVAVGLLLPGGGADVDGWPLAAGADGCTRRTTIAGPLERQLTFDQTGWVQLDLGM